MSDVSQQTAPSAMAKSILGIAQKAVAIQSELSGKLTDANTHWLEQVQTESNAIWELSWKVSNAVSFADKIKLLQDWLKGATERGAQDVIYALEAARELRDIELKFFGHGKSDKLVSEVA
jgi:hypothetical protein